jgi:aspartate carbamoyltransferase catalytic subunit
MTTTLSNHALETRDHGAVPAITPLSAWWRRHLLDLEGVQAWEVEQVLDRAQQMQRLRMEPTFILQGRVVANVFLEPSTRTRLSFDLAAQRLGAHVLTMTAAESSVTKGESLLETLLTLEALGARIIVLRQSENAAPDAVAHQLTTASLINAGDGSRGHPSQALLDMFTIRERLGRLAGVRVAIVGDISHSRVAHSNACGLATMGAEVVLCGPENLLPEEGAWSGAHTTSDLGAALAGADVVMALRLQEERHNERVDRIAFAEHYQITGDRLRLAKPGALVMHPGPVLVGVEVAPEVAYSPQSAIRDQVRNGVAVRMALLALIAST